MPALPFAINFSPLFIIAYNIRKISINILILIKTLQKHINKKKQTLKQQKKIIFNEKIKNITN